MEKYIINKFEHQGVFLCTEERQEDGEIFLIGKFENKKTKMTFIKQVYDKKLQS